ncbi:MAG TPA: DUF86 domain-containing protein [Candidatus Pacearchaeota archaeon]|nr:DUF86 domain-containing protein [Candidatus Pacearchaeota archaeon]HPO06919.1 DUF86 domain-containing protein [Candidatus Pacearchaeota archaeon]
MKRTQKIYIYDIAECVEYVENYMKGVLEGNFLKDHQKQDAVFRRLEIIGEAAKYISTDFWKKYPEVAWRDICGLRDKIVHEYFGIDPRKIWHIVKDDLPVLKKQIAGILESMNNNQKKLL